MKVLVVIPTYNENDNIVKLLETIIRLKWRGLDILVVDDNSPDGTSDAVKRLKSKITHSTSSGQENQKSNIFILDRKKKEGLGKAYVAGFKWALARNYDRIVTMDADFSHHPKYLPIILEKAKKYDLVIGSRYIKGGKIVGWEWFRYFNSLSANIFTKLLLILDPKDVTAGFKCYSRKFLQAIRMKDLLASGYAFQVEMIYLAKEKGIKMIEIPITFIDRRAGKSKISGELGKSIKAVFQLAMQKRTYRQMVKFAIVGALGAAVDWSIYLLLTRVISVYYLIARTISFCFGVLNNYLWNKFWTFKDKNGEITVQFFRYLFVSGVGLIINLMIMYIIVDIFHSSDLYGLIAATAVVGIWNFVANKFWIFNNTD